MKIELRGRILGVACCVLFASLAAVSAPAVAAQIVSDDFTYPNGPLVTVGSPWANHSGTVGQIQVNNGQITLVQTGQSEDANLPFGGAISAGTTVYAAFDLTVPTIAGTVTPVYFAHFFQNTSIFRTRVFLLPPSAGGSGYRLGISDSTAPGNSGVDLWPSNLSFGTTYTVVSSYSFDTGEGRLWIDPVTQADFSLSIIGGVGTPIVAFAFREANAGVNFQQVIDNLCVADAFADVFNCQALPPTGACCPAPRGAECCPGDLNGDQVVDDLDAGPFVTALLNNVYDACADMQPDLADNGADIQPFVVAALAETPCAAACFELTEDECESDGGTYQGNNTICDPETCIIPTTGACCVNSVCTDVSEEDCDSAGGLFAGLGNDCDENPCVGRCCLGANCGVQSLASCQSVGGTYGGDGTTCTPNPCTGGCSNIAQTRTLPDGASARVCGVISSVTDLVIGGNPEVASFQLQDGSGEDNQSALTVFGPQTLIVSILANAGGLGAQVELRGTVNIFNGLFELDNGTTPLELIATTGNPGAPAPFLVEPADFQDQSPTAEGLESEVVRVECVQFIELEPPFYDAGAFGRNYIVTDGTTTFTVRIAHPGLNLQFENIPIGPANLTGIFGQSDNSADPVDAGYQLLLRTTNDDEEVQPGDEDCPIPTGACCHDDICDVVTRRECIENFAGGYYGDGTNCDEGCPNYCIIISEIVDGDRTGGTPKYVEITNTGSSPYTFSAGSGIIVSNSPTAVEIDHDLSGMTILAGESYVAAGSGQNGQAQFESTYAPPGYPAGPIVANAYVDGISGNGDDAVALADGGTIIDIYGFLGSDGTGTPWQYEDSVATRNFSASTADGLFHVTDWTITDLDGADEAASLALLRSNTNPKAHDFEPCILCEQPANARTVEECIGAACTGSSYCSYLVQGNTENLPPNCAVCTTWDGQSVCVPCDGPNCAQNDVEIFRIADFNGEGDDCYFEGVIFSGGPCLAPGNCTTNRFNDAP